MSSIVTPRRSVLAWGAWLALAALLALPSVASAAVANTSEGLNARAILTNPRALARYLRLSPAQVEQQKALLQALHTEVEPLRGQQKDLQDDLQALLAGANPDACTVGGIVVDINELGDAIRAALAEFDEDFSAILTPEQLARYEALKVLAGRAD